jgi:hypothetical protein
MKIFFILILIIMFSSSMVFRGLIYGSIKSNRKSVGEGIEIEIKSNGKAYKTKTDKHGSYHLNIREGSGMI